MNARTTEAMSPPRVRASECAATMPMARSTSFAASACLSADSGIRFAAYQPAARRWRSAIASAQANGARLALILAIVAAVLAFSAAVIRYRDDGEIRWSLIAAGIFILAFGFGAKARIGPKE